ncbi:hypothetical protein RD792_012898 [Penstemon davidsonii]|uniref:Uncharacterized protein n=1 Tax=Penstemon davidsonii TaxID=160366 RepID=A0ABR0CYI9_9LAMI|nr:hypothetical protein RD792_012898 [Penstemon davidsonii]
MGHHTCCNKQKVKRGLWSPEEDEKLINYISAYGHGCWSAVPRLAGLQRCGKSCRLRWINYLRPDLKRGSFSPPEAALIIELHRILGNRWAQIAKHLPGRTDNEVKNFWNSSIKKKLLQQQAANQNLIHQYPLKFSPNQNYYYNQIQIQNPLPINPPPPINPFQGGGLGPIEPAPAVHNNMMMMMNNVYNPNPNPNPIQIPIQPPVDDLPPTWPDYNENYFENDINNFMFSFNNHEKAKGILFGAPPSPAPTPQDQVFGPFTAAGEGSLHPNHINHIESLMGSFASGASSSSSSSQPGNSLAPLPFSGPVFLNPSLPPNWGR